MRRFLFTLLFLLALQINASGILPEDLDGDGSVTITDIMRVVSKWGAFATTVDYISPEMVLVEGGNYMYGPFEGNPIKVLTLNTQNYYIANNIDTNNLTEEISISSFYIGKYEVTFDEYDLYTVDTGKTLAYDNYNWGRGTQPVFNVSWYDAIEYCNWLSIKENKTPCYIINKEIKDTNNLNSSDPVKWTVQCNWNENGYRLPTQVEWEFAASGGMRNPIYYFSGSNNMSEVAWYSESYFSFYFNNNSNKRTAPVGLLWPNQLNIYDMSGNVEEWCWNWYSSEITPVSSNYPNGQLQGSYKIVKGCSFNSYSISIKDRVVAPAFYKMQNVGFRLVRNASPE